MDGTPNESAGQYLKFQLSRNHPQIFGTFIIFILLKRC